MLYTNLKTTRVNRIATKAVILFECDLHGEGKEIWYQCKASLERIEAGESNEPTISKFRQEMSVLHQFKGLQG